MNDIIKILLCEKHNGYKNGLYHFLQIHFAYNSNHIEGSTLSKDQTRFIYEKDSFIAEPNQIIKTNDLLEAKNHFRAFDFILDNIYGKIDINFMKQLHFLVKKDCSDIQVIGDFKKRQNFVGDIKTTPPKQVSTQIEKLLDNYAENNSFEDIIDFHFHFEKIHPFEDGNGRVGRLLMFKECLKNNIVPFVIDEKHRLFYYRGLKEYENTKGYLIDTCLSCQDDFKAILQNFEINIAMSAESMQDSTPKTHKAKRRR